jgi:iron complex outermembrane receptor protein
MYKIILGKITLVWKNHIFHFMKNLFAIFIVFLLLYSYNYAQTDTLQENEIRTELDTVIIEAARSGKSDLDIPFSVDFINAEQVNRGEQGRTLGESLFPVSGVFLDDRYNPAVGEKINIRGIGSRASFGVRGIKILLDDIPLTMPDGQAQLSNIDLGSEGSVEIIKGPSSALYGNAAGGVINIKTEEPSHFPFSFQPSFTMGAFGYKKAEGKFSGTIGKYSYLLNMSKLNSDGFRDHSDFSSYAINSDLGMSVSSTLNLKLIFNYFDSPYALNPSSLTKGDAEMSPSSSRDYVKQQGAGEKSSQWQTGVSMIFTPNSYNRLEMNVYFITRDLTNPIPGRIINLNRNAAGFRSAYNYFLSLKNYDLNFTLGADIETQFDDRKEYSNLGLPANYSSISPEDIFDKINYGDKLLDQEEKVIGIGPFLQGEVTFSSLSFLLGLRYNNYKFIVDDRFFDDGSDDSGNRTMDKLSTAAGINYRVDELSKLYFNYSTSFQTPTTAELSNRADGKGGFNPDLLSEDIYSLELGYKKVALLGLFNLDASLFYLRFSNLLIPYQIPASEETFYKNAGKAENKGIELTLEYFPFKDINASLSYSGYDFTFKDYLAEANVNGVKQTYQLAGNSVPGVPSNKIAAGINYNSDEIGLFGSIRFIWEDKYFANDFNGPIPGTTLPQSDFINDGYVKTDLRFGYLLQTDFTNAQFFFGVNNIFDVKYNGSIVPNADGYRFFEPAPGRNWYGGVRLSVPSR